MRRSYSPLDRGLDAEAMTLIAERLSAVALDARKPVWLRELAFSKAMEARAFARVAYVNTMR